MKTKKLKRYHVIHQVVEAFSGKVRSPFICTTTEPMTLEQAINAAEDIAMAHIDNSADDEESFRVVGHPMIRRMDTACEWEAALFYDSVDRGQAFRDIFWIVEK